MRHSDHPAAEQLLLIWSRVLKARLPDGKTAARWPAAASERRALPAGDDTACDLASLLR